MANSIPQERTAGTDAFYERKYDQLAVQAGLRVGIQKGAYVAPIHVVNHLLSRRSHLAKRTWQVYKSACVAHMEHFAAQTSDPALAQEYRHASSILKVETQTEALTRGTQGSSLKGKRVLEDDHNKLVAYLETRRHVDKWAAITQTLCQASYLTGLRPGEWRGAWVERSADGQVLLSVSNAKNTQGRANGDRRHLDLGELTAAEVDLIENMAQAASHYDESEDTWASVQTKVANYLYQTVRKVFGRRKRYLSLYSYRHQFSADSKATWSQQEVAALMGHGSDETAARNYARASVGRKGHSKVKPLQAEVATVRRVARVRPPKPALPT